MMKGQNYYEVSVTFKKFGLLKAILFNFKRMA